MAHLTCHNCGHTNAADATFCGKCATHLRQSQLRRQHQNRVLVPPQVAQVRQVHLAPRRSVVVGRWWLGMIVVIVGVIVWWIASRG